MYHVCTYSLPVGVVMHGLIHVPVYIQSPCGCGDAWSGPSVGECRAEGGGEKREVPGQEKERGRMVRFTSPGTSLTFSPVFLRGQG